MKTIKPLLPAGVCKPIASAIPINIPVKKRKINTDIVLNVGFKDALIRIGISLFLAIVMVFTDAHLIIYISPVVFYLFVSALTKFCIVKYAWHRYIKHEPAPIALDYGKDPNYPEESI